MSERLIHISDCHPGYVLTRDLFNKRGIFLVGKGSCLSEYLIEKMINMGITSVYVDWERGRAMKTLNSKSFEAFEEDYQQAVDSVKTVINDLAKGKELNHDTVETLTDHLYQGIEEKDNIIGCLSTLKAFDEYTYNHSINVALYSMLIAKWLDLPELEIKKAIEAGLLHDIGKSLIPNAILNKEGKLTDEEFEIMKQHPTFSYNLAKKAEQVPQDILKAILMHHEREDGSGYPMGISGDKINLLAKIVAIADVYDALTSERIYKKRITPFDTFKIIETTGLGYFDTLILLTFLHNIASYYIGAEVSLNTGAKGKIVHVVPHNISRPIVCVDNNYIDTGKYEHIKIEALIN